MQKLILVATAVLTLGQTAWGHGMMIDPPQRSSMWRYGYNTPENTDDNQLYCGGLSRQWTTNGGKCGVCGDPYDAPQPHENEAGGKYATGVIVRTYQQGSIIDVAVKITANHKGYFVFKLCPNIDVRKRVTQACLDNHVLRAVGPNGQDLGDKYYIDTGVNTKYLKLKLPQDVTCSQCVLQWTYITANSWGCMKDDPEHCCTGCGPQENFVNCADVAITGSGQLPRVTNSPRPAYTTAPKITTTRKPAATQSPNRITSGCHSLTGESQMDTWCVNNCALGYCPATHCQCS